VKPQAAPLHALRALSIAPPLLAAAVALTAPVGAQAVRGAPSALARAGSTARTPDANGYLRRWLLLDPITIAVRSNQQLTDSFVQAVLKKEYFPNQFTAVPKDGDTVTVDGKQLAWHAFDASGFNVNLYHFARDHGKPPFNAVYWAVTVVNCPREMPGVRLAVGSNSASIWWVNGSEVVDLYGDRHMLVDDGVSKRLTLNKGANVVRCAVVNAPGLSNMCARFLDADGKPLKELIVTLERTGPKAVGR
jgi:hypothetical protein